MNYFKLLICVYFITNCAFGKSTNFCSHERFEILGNQFCDTLNRHKFFLIVKESFLKIDNGRRLSNDEFKEMVKIYNTLNLPYSILSKNDSLFFQKYKTRFEQNYIKNLVLSKRVIKSTYSDILLLDYNIRILGSITIHTNSYSCNDIFVLVDD